MTFQVTQCTYFISILITYNKTKKLKNCEYSSTSRVKWLMKLPSEIWTMIETHKNSPFFSLNNETESHWHAHESPFNRVSWKLSKNHYPWNSSSVRLLTTTTTQKKLNEISPTFLNEKVHETRPMRELNEKKEIILLLGQKFIVVVVQVRKKNKCKKGKSEIYIHMKRNIN